MPRGRSKPVPELPAWVQAIRHRRLIELRGKTQEDVAADSGLLTQRTISDLENGRYEPGDLTNKRLVALARGLEWTPIQLQDATGLDLGFSPPDEVRLGMRTVPVLASVGAGPGGCDGERVGSVPIPAAWPGDYCAYVVQGTSMDPTVHDGDVVIVQLDPATAEFGKLVVAWLPGPDDRGSMVVKRLVPSNREEALALSSDNPDYGLVVAPGARVIGAVRSRRRDYD